jgi:hypothetical protein
MGLRTTPEGEKSKNLVDNFLDYGPRYRLPRHEGLMTHQIGWQGRNPGSQLLGVNLTPLDGPAADGAGSGLQGYDLSKLDKVPQRSR